MSMTSTIVTRGVQGDRREHLGTFDLSGNYPNPVGEAITPALVGLTKIDDVQIDGASLQDGETAPTICAIERDGNGTPIKLRVFKEGAGAYAEVAAGGALGNAFTVRFRARGY